MQRFLIVLVFNLLSTIGMAAQIDPATTSFPWMNGPARDSVYRLTDAANVNKVHVFEAYALSCSWCNSNAAQVKRLAAEYARDPRVQFMDLGMDANEGQYRTWISRHQPSYPVVKDVGRRVYAALINEEGVPQTFVVACDGQLIGQTIGYWGSGEIANLKAAIAKAKETSCE